MNRTLLLLAGIAVIYSAIVTGFQAPPWNGSPSGPDDSAPANGPGRTVAEPPATIREVSAYNVGVGWQTDEFPCIGAMGNDLCELVEAGRKICAANFVALGTILHIEGFGDYVVLDRVNPRYGHRVDIAMREDQVAQAKRFGVWRLAVAVR